MTHEFHEIIAAYTQAAKQGLSCVLASVVDLDGSSYRRPGVRMLITETGQQIGAISGGCVEKEVVRQAETVFKTATAKVISYDGKYRLGCDGFIYILLEPFAPPAKMLPALAETIEKRSTFHIKSYYRRTVETSKQFGSVLYIKKESFAFNSAEELTISDTTLVLEQELEPMFQLYLFGGEHDANKLSNQAAMLGWQVTVVTHPIDGYTKNDFPKAHHVMQSTADSFDSKLIDQNTAIVLMTHNYAKDLHFLLALKDTTPCYLGLLGPVRRRNKLLNEFIEHQQHFPDELLNAMHGPAGLDIGSETAEEIALAICSEIVSVVRKRNAQPLRELETSIHA